MVTLLKPKYTLIHMYLLLIGILPCQKTERIGSVPSLTRATAPREGIFQPVVTCDPHLVGRKFLGCLLQGTLVPYTQQIQLKEIENPTSGLKKRNL